MRQVPQEPGPDGLTFADWDTCDCKALFKHTTYTVHTKAWRFCTWAPNATEELDKDRW